MDKPLVSILMPAYNAASYIEEACKSILLQTYSNLEIIIVDDCSIDDTADRIRKMNDHRIKLFRNEVNQGLAASLNFAIRSAKGKYLARMDADDICYSSRIQKQVNYLEAHPQISLLGTGLKYFNYSNYKNYFPKTHESCKAKLLFNVCFGHSSLMFRKTVFEQEGNLYNPQLKQYSEDYELYSRLVDHFQFSNLPELLIKYRTFDRSVKEADERNRKNNSRAVRLRMLLAMGIPESEMNLNLHCKASDLAKLNLKDELHEIISWFEYLIKINSRSKYFNAQALKLQLSEQLFEIVYHNYHLNMRLSDLTNCSFFELSNISTQSRGKYLLKKMAYLYL